MKLNERVPGGGVASAGILPGVPAPNVMDFLPRRSRRGRCQALQANGHRCESRATIETTIHERRLDKWPTRWVVVRVCDDHWNFFDKSRIKQSDDRRRLQLESMNHRKQFVAGFKNQYERRTKVVDHKKEPPKEA